MINFNNTTAIYMMLVHALVYLHFLAVYHLCIQQLAMKMLARKKNYSSLLPVSLNLLCIHAIGKLIS